MWAGLAICCKLISVDTYATRPMHALRKRSSLEEVLSIPKQFVSRS